MPAGLSPSDFFSILPEMVLALGAMLVLLTDVYLPRDSRAITWLSVAVLVVPSPPRWATSSNNVP